MPFLDQIVAQLVTARDWFWSAYQTVYGWTWPFSLLATPLYYIYVAFHYLTYYFGQFNTWLTWAAGEIASMISLGDVQTAFATIFAKAESAYSNWLSVYGIVRSYVLNVWSDVQQTVLAWIDNAKYWLQAQIDSLELLIADLRVLWYEIADKIPSLTEVIAWFTNWWANILSPLTSWWNERLLDVKGLIQSELKDWFPFYDDLVNLWSSIKEFFVDPLGWLEAKFTDWFLGAE